MKTEAIDLSGFLPEDETVLEITTPAGAPSGWKVTLAGPGHPKTIAANEAATRKALRREQQMEAQQRNGRKVKPEDRNPEEVRRENVEMVVNRIVDWTPVKIGAETFDFTSENAVRLLLNPKMAWAYVQIIEALADEVFYEGLRDGLIAHAEAVFALNRRDSEGVTERERIEGLISRARDDARREELECELDVPPRPPELDYLWLTYRRLRNRKAGSGFGPSPIEWPDIAAYVQFSGQRFAPWEVEIIEALDDAYLATKTADGD